MNIFSRFVCSKFMFIPSSSHHHKCIYHLISSDFPVISACFKYFRVSYKRYYAFIIVNFVYFTVCYMFIHCKFTFFYIFLRLFQQNKKLFNVHDFIHYSINELIIIFFLSFIFFKYSVVRLKLL